MKFIFLIVSLLTWSLSSYASNTTNISGFGTLGLNYSDSEQYGYRKDVSQNEAGYKGDLNYKSNSLLGLQLDSRLTDNTDFIAQAVLRDMAKSELSRYFTLGFIRYTASPNWAFRVGRTSPDLFLLTEYRDIDIAYTWATVPQEVYGLIPYRHIDGADVIYTQRIKGGVFSSKVFTGITEAEISSGYTTQTIELDDVFGISLTYDKFNWTIQAKHTQVKVAQEIESNKLLLNTISALPDFIWPNPEEFIKKIAINNQQIKYTSLNGQIRQDNWLLSAEISTIKSDSGTVPDIDNAYIALSYQFDVDALYSIYAFNKANIYEFNEPDVNVSLIPELITAINSATNFYTSNQQTLSLGWRRDHTMHFATTVQLNVTHIDQNGGVLWINRGEDSPAATINNLLFNLSFTF